MKTIKYQYLRDKCKRCDLAEADSHINVLIASGAEKSLIKPTSLLKHGFPKHRYTHLQAITSSDDTQRIFSDRFPIDSGRDVSLSHHVTLAVHHPHVRMPIQVGHLPSKFVGQP